MTSLEECVSFYLADLKRHYDSKQIKGRYYRLKAFIEWSLAKEITEPSLFSRDVVEAYLQYLSVYKQQNDKPYSAVTIRGKINAVKSFFSFLYKHGHLLFNPASGIELPKEFSSLPGNILSVKEVETLMAVVDTTNPLGVRDRAILETFYSTGIRNNELSNLKTGDLDREKGVLWVRAGKGGNERIIPIGSRAIDWITRYINEVRPNLAEKTAKKKKSEADYLFLSWKFCRLDISVLSRLVHKYYRKAGFKGRGSCHLLRHCMATHLLENGADIRYIQEMLGHSKLETTQIYTRVSIHKLIEVHKKTHPGAKKGRFYPPNIPH